MSDRQGVKMLSRSILTCFLASFAIASTMESKDAPTATRDPRWAVALKRPGIANLHRVSDSLYRGAQPTTEGFRELEMLGIKTVVNLRSMHSDRKLLKGFAIGYERIFFDMVHAEDKDILRFLKIVSDPERTPVFVHCQRGADRTGVMAAVYRICIQGWSKDEAIEEMTHGGYGFAPIWKHYVRYVEKLDVDKLRREAGLAPATPEREIGATPVQTTIPAPVAP